MYGGGLEVGWCDGVMVACKRDGGMVYGGGLEVGWCDGVLVAWRYGGGGDMMVM